MEITHAGVSITVITANSPLGKQLMGRKVGESIGLHGERLAVLKVL
jgi:transcription elongation GreA/GreB family factor